MKRGHLSIVKLGLFTMLILISLEASASELETVELGQQVKDSIWKVTCFSMKQVTYPNSVAVMTRGSGLQLVRRFTPSEGSTLVQIGCTIENLMPIEVHYSLKDVHTYSIPQDGFYVVGINRGRTNEEDPHFFLTLANPEIMDEKVAVAPSEKDPIILLFVHKANTRELRFRFRNLRPYRLSR
jgi:hypothetical protein